MAHGNLPLVAIQRVGLTVRQRRGRDHRRLIIVQHDTDASACVHASSCGGVVVIALARDWPEADQQADTLCCVAPGLAKSVEATGAAALRS